MKSANLGAPAAAGVVTTESAGRATRADVVVRRIAAHEAPDQGHRIRFVHDLRARLLVQIRLQREQGIGNATSAGQHANEPAVFIRDRKLPERS